MQGLLDRSGFGVTLVDRKSEDDAALKTHQLVAEGTDTGDRLPAPRHLLC